MAVMMTPRETWTDERLDELNKKVDDGFKEVNARFDRLEGRFERMEERFHALNRTLLGGAAVIAAAIIGAGAF